MKKVKEIDDEVFDTANISKKLQPRCKVEAFLY